MVAAVPKRNEQVEVAIRDLSVLAGRLAPRAMGLVAEWASAHQSELLAVWDEAMAHRTLTSIEPLR